MSEKRRKLAVGYTVVLVGVAIGVLVVACDAPVPTELRETVDEVVANEAGEGTVPVLANRPAQSPLAKWFDSEAAPLLFVDRCPHRYTRGPARSGPAVDRGRP